MSAPSPTYLELLNEDGTRNAAAFASILNRRVTAEINLRLCAAAGIRAPSLSLGEIAAWRAGVVKTLDQSLVGPAERRRVEAYERAELEAFVSAMQEGARKQRDAMNAAYLEAAE